MTRDTRQLLSKKEQRFWLVFILVIFIPAGLIGTVGCVWKVLVQGDQSFLVFLTVDMMARARRAGSFDMDMPMHENLNIDPVAETLLSFHV